MTDQKELLNTFTSKQAVDLFKAHTGFEFHPTVPGQLLDRCGIRKIPSISKPSRFDAKNWALVWEEMHELALRRCRFDRTLQPPKKCFAPTLPQAEDAEPARGKEYFARVPSPAPSLDQIPVPASQWQPISPKACIQAALEAARKAAEAAGLSRDLKRPATQKATAVPSNETEEVKRVMPMPPQPESVTPALKKRSPGPEFGCDLLSAPAQVRDLKPHPTRQFIEVPFEEKDEAKWLGARWDLLFKKWYVPSGLNRNLFRWPDALLPPNMRAVEFSSDEPSKPSRSRKKKANPAGKSTVAAKRMEKELDGRLRFLLDKID